VPVVVVTVAVFCKYVNLTKGLWYYRSAWSDNLTKTYHRFWM